MVGTEKTADYKSAGTWKSADYKSAETWDCKSAETTVDLPRKRYCSVGFVIRRGKSADYKSAETT